ncbi:ricin-type beta-trefoil lectin domain protein [Actinokineospora sp.]|uniref:ricin-type beta-trefoil lectin domain protein n=1 Tax=Actinokineospora sp. TaxID=1872133 RepID=UPI003D6C0DF5
MPRLLSALIGLLAVAALATPAQAAPTAGATPLSPELEAIRAAEAVALYGSPEIRPMDQRKTGIATMGDSEISGEGEGPYETGTNGDDDGDGDQNWCHRSYAAGIHRTGIAVDKTYNLACSGAVTQNLIAGNGVRQWDELNQGDNLAIKARNTRIKLVWIVASANDGGGLEFGPVITDCTIKRIFFQGECWPAYTDQVQARVTVSGANLRTAVTSVKQTMVDAGYAAGDYQLVVMSYPSPVSPDVEDTPNFPGWYGGGCTMYLRDMAIGRNKVVPLFERAVRAAAEGAGARYLDASRLFHGHETCTGQPWTRGVVSSWGDAFDPNTYRQSWHPNAGGHGAFGSCVKSFYDNPSWSSATCTSTDSAVRVRQGLLDFTQLRNTASTLCVDAQGHSTRNGYALIQWGCHGARNQGWWYDSTTSSLHIELTHDRCADVATGVGVGRPLIVWDCHGGWNQKFLLDGTLIRAVVDPGLCVAVPDTAWGRQLSMAPCDGSDPRQQWAGQPKTGTAGYGYNDWMPSSAY